MATEKWFKKTHCAIYSTNIDTVLCYHLTIEDSRHCVLSDLLCWSWVILTIESGLIRHTVLYIPRRLIQLCFIIWPVEKSDTMCKLIYCAKVGYFWKLKTGLSRHTVLDISQRIIQFCFVIWPVKIADTMCYLIYCVKVGYFWQLKVV